MIYSYNLIIVIIIIISLNFITGEFKVNINNNENNIPIKESIKLTLNKNNNNINNGNDKTIMGYSLTNDFNFYNNSIIGINWESIDILIIPSTLSRIKEIISIANNNNVKVCLMYSYLDIELSNDGHSSLSSLNRSVFEMVQKVDRLGAEGISMFFKFPVDEFYLLKISTIYHVLKGYNPSFQLSVSIPVKVGSYKLNEISKYCDLLIANSYDMGNFNNGQLAIPNSPGNSIRLDIFNIWITKFKIPKNKIILGLGWYGYKFNCSSKATFNIFSKDCIINGNGVSKIMYKDIYKYTIGKHNYHGENIDNIDDDDQYELTSMELWDTLSRTPYLNFRRNGINYFQIRYDNPKSIYYKLAETGIGGVAIWRIDQIVNLPLIEIKNMYNSINRNNIGNEFNENFEFW